MERAELVHLGIYCRDVEVLRKFYSEVFGLVVTDEGNTRIGYLVFLTSDPAEHHQLVLVSGRAPDQKSTVNQISFRLKTLSDLREMRDLLQTRGVAFRPVDHGIAWSLYIEDPEGNGIEVYVDAPWSIAQPYGKPLDLDRTNDEIMAATEAMCRAEPSYRTRREWETVQRAKF